MSDSNWLRPSNQPLEVMSSVDKKLHQITKKFLKSLNKDFLEKGELIIEHNIELWYWDESPGDGMEHIFHSQHKWPKTEIVPDIPSLIDSLPKRTKVDGRILHLKRTKYHIYVLNKRMELIDRFNILDKQV